MDRPGSTKKGDTGLPALPPVREVEHGCGKSSNDSTNPSQSILTPSQNTYSNLWAIRTALRNLPMRI